MFQCDVCCKAIDKNFDCYRSFKKGFANLHLLASQKKNYLQYRKFTITGLRAALGQLKNIA